jgi:hypothetical protein
MRTRVGDLYTVLRRVEQKIPRTVWVQCLILFGLALVINWRLVQNSAGCVNWGNYLLPCASAQYAAWVPYPLVWQPFSFMGSPTTLPFSTAMFSTLTFYPVAGLSTFLGPAQGAGWYAVASTVFVGLAFTAYATTLVRSYWGTTVAMVFFVAGPFQIQIYGVGDYGLIVAEGFLFLAVYLLWRAVRDPRRRWILYPASLGCMVLTAGAPQVLELGLLLYVCSLAAFVFIPEGARFRPKVASFARLSVRFLLLPFLLTPLILPALTSAAIDLGPGSPYANPLSVFSGLSASPVSVFLTLGYVAAPGSSLTNFTGYAMVSSAANALLANVWLVLIVLLVLVIWAVVLFLGDRRGIYLLLLAIVGSLLGSGVEGPLGGLNTYLYLHLTGYQELNASYYWDLVIVVPALATALGIAVERSIARSRSGGRPAFSFAHIAELRSRAATPLGRRRISDAGVSPIQVVGLLVGLLVVASVAVPFGVVAQDAVGQGQTVGIQVTDYPGDYAAVFGSLSRLVGTTYSGVAVFGPTPQWITSGASSTTESYFFYFPTERIPSIPGYNLLPISSNYYTYWAYDQLFSNASPYVGELLAASGIGYLLVFYGTQTYPPYLLPQAVGQNVSDLLTYQYGIVPVVTSQSFAIYKDLYFTGSAASLSSLSIVAGSYSELNAMAYAGVNLTGQGLVFPTDIPASSCGDYIDRTSEVYAETPNALDGLALDCSSSSSSNPVSVVTGDNTVSEGWASSYSYASGALGLSVVESWPTPLAVTEGGPHSIHVPIDANGCSSCSIWALVRLGSSGGSLAFQWDGGAWILQTNRSWGGYNNSMVWIQLPFEAYDGGTLVVTSLTGWNALGPVYVASNSSVSQWLHGLESTKPIALAESGYSLALPTLRLPGQSTNYCGLNTLGALDQVSLCIQSLGPEAADYNLTLPSAESGWLSLLVRSFSTGDIQIGATANQTVGFDTGSHNFSRYQMGWVRVPVSSREVSTNGTIPLGVVDGVVYFSEFVFSPISTYDLPVPSVPQPALSVNSTSLTPAVSGLNVSVTKAAGSLQQISGSLQFTSPGYGANVASVSLNRTPAGVADVGIEYSVSPGLILNLDGMRLGGDGEVGLNQYTVSMLSVSAQYNVSRSALAFYSTANLSDVVNASFSIQVEYGTMALNSTLSNLGSGTNWTVSGTSTGFQLLGGPASMILVRVPFYPSLLVSPSGFAIQPAFGSVDSILVGSTNATEITVTTKAAAALESGLEIMGGTFAAWVAAEFLWMRYRRKQTTPAQEVEVNPGLESNELSASTASEPSAAQLQIDVPSARETLSGPSPPGPGPPVP